MREFLLGSSEPDLRRDVIQVLILSLFIFAFGWWMLGAWWAYVPLCVALMLVVVGKHYYRLSHPKLKQPVTRYTRKR